MIAQLISVGLRHKLLVFMVTVGVCVFGILCLRRLPIDAFPDISPNLVQVFAEIEGMAAEEVEQLVTRPVEIAMRGIPCVKKIRSLSSLGLSTVNIYFEDNLDIYFARQLVTERLKLAEEGIPPSVDMPHGLEMGPVASGMGKILSYYLEAEGHDIAELRTLQEWIIKRDIETIPGVAKVVSQGGHVQEYQVNVHPDRLLSLGLSLQDVVEALEASNANVGAGLVKRGSEEWIVRSLGRIKDISDIEQVCIKTYDGQPTLVKDVATVTFGNAFRRGVAIMDGNKEVVLGGIYKLHRANSFEVIRRLNRRIDQINETLPSGVRIVPFYDQSELVRNSIRTVRGALLLGLVLVCLVAFLFLGDLRNALIMVCSLPFSILTAFILMERNGIPGDLISFGGVAIALGMIIDATIIMVEKIQTALAEKSGQLSVTEIITASAQEVGRPIVFAVSIIVIVFLPIFTLGEVEGKMFRPLAFAVATTMAGSLFYALVIAPVFYRILHRPDSGKRKSKSGHSPVLVRILDVYEAGLKHILIHPLLVVVAVVAIFIGGIMVFLGLGREFLPSLHEGVLQCYAYMNPNISLDQIKETSAQISESLKQLPEVKHVVADIGYGEVGPHVHHTNYACMTITLEPQKQWKTASTQEGLANRLHERIVGYLGTTAGFSQPIDHELDGLVSGVGATVAAKVFGHDMDVLQTIATDIEQVLAQIPGVTDLRVEQTSGQTQLQIDLDSARLARYGLKKQDVQRLIHNAITGREVGHVFQGEKSFRILTRFDEPYRQDIDTISAMLIPTPDGAQIPLRQLADIRTTTGLRQISREDTQRYVSVQCNVTGRDEGGFVTEAQKRVRSEVNLPPGYRVAWGGQFELQQAANKRLAIVVPITLLLVLAMLYGLFSSLKNVLLIMLNVPLALVGGVFALSLFGENVSIPSSIGFIALFGIALTDGLVLISRFEVLRKQGQSLYQAVIAGCRSKFRPVLMTTLTTALGLLPLIIATGTGSEVQRPLAIVVVGGLTSSTLLTLIVVPTLYLWISQKESMKENPK
ncbi:MAG: efflux RND transporter permease subunit [Phycisphaerales bacterium]|nr:MAG: efflux RND transporter permease subunit [Phycisphaerales bacterium]